MHERRREKAELDAKEPEEQPARRERERHGKPQRKEQHQAGEHERRHVRVHEVDHRACSSTWARMASASSSSGLFSSLLRVGSSMRLIRKATRLISSETPWMPSNAKPIGTNAKTGQRIKPPSLDDISPVT